MTKHHSDLQSPPDRIHLRNHVVSAEIGAFQTERGLDQRLRFDITADLAEGIEGAGDDVDRILSYDRLTEAVTTALASERFNLVETLAERIASGLLVHPQVASVTVTVEKLDRAPGALGITITRRAPRVRANDVTLARPVLLVASRGHTGITGPAIVLPATATTGPSVSDARAARRIALIALDQAAWALSADLPESVVADSRTELDWAVAEGRVAIWAPARMVADTELAAEPAALAFWLARKMNASRVEFALRSGDKPPLPPPGFDIPVTRRKD